VFFGWPPDASWRMTGSDLIMWADAAEAKIAAAEKAKHGR
jgi:hypothetical protein